MKKLAQTFAISLLILAASFDILQIIAFTMLPDSALASTLKNIINTI